MRLVRVYALVALEDGETVDGDLSGEIADAIQDAGFDVRFASMAEGYDGEFAEMGATL